MPGKLRIIAGPLSSDCKILNDEDEPVLIGNIQSIQIQIKVGAPVRASLELINVLVSAEVDMREVVSHVNEGPLWQDIDLSRADAVVVRLNKKYTDASIAQFRKYFEEIVPDRPVIFTTDDMQFEGLVLQRKVTEELLSLRERVRELTSQLADSVSGV